MLFNSFEFLIFFPAVVLLFFLLPHKYRWILLLVASYFFYMWWKVEYAIILVISTVIDYFCGLMMGKHLEKRKRKPYLYLSLFSNLGILFTFKYFNFFNGAAEELSNLLGMSYAVPAFELLLPMGISFYTFQTMSYSIDVYNNEIKPERHFGIFALFVTFFPQLVAGPIERAGHLLGQLREKKYFDYNNVTNGLKLIAWGFFKKVVIADRLAPMVNQVYNNPSEFDGLALIIATIFFAFQIYCDFSGYSEIAIGTGQVMGFEFMKNFRRPYFAKSISEFWHRWHISLSTWFRDYLYIPLGGSRVIKWRWYYNIFVVFLVSGLWHGANWTFIVWGALHGFFQIFGSITKKIRNSIVSFIKLDRFPTIYNAVQTILTFVLVCFAWIFFRANSMSDAKYIVFNLFNFNNILLPENWLRTINAITSNNKAEFLLAVLLIIFLETVQSYQSRIAPNSLRAEVAAKPAFIRMAIYSIAVISILFLGVFTHSQFIYFQF